jgi:Uma2 family endonuclease
MAMSNTIVSAPAITAPIVVIQAEQESDVVRVPAEAATLAGFRDWATSESFPQRGEISFIDGKVMVDMSPENLDLHNFLKGEISSVLRNLIRDQDLGRLFFDRCLLTSVEAELSTEPDAMFLSYESHAAAKARYVESRSTQGSYVEVLGSPDWVLEIVSPSSGKKDKEHLRRAYYRAGVAEYWIADALNEPVELMILLRGTDDFLAVHPQNGWCRSSVFGCAFRITRSKARDGLWEYTLEVKS